MPKNGRDVVVNKSQRGRVETAISLLTTVLDCDSQEVPSTFDATSLARALCSKAKRHHQSLPEFPSINQPWRALLQLYVAEADGVKIAVTDLAPLCGCAPTTNLRIQSLLLDLSLIHKVADPNDRRRIWLALTDLGKSNVVGVLKEFSARLTTISQIPVMVR